MTDVLKNEPLKVIVAPTGGAAIWVPVAQLDRVQSLFDRNGVNYWLSTSATSLDGRNFVRVVSVSKNEDHARVQALLDATP